jgi:toxin-antitoxin system PIN domain toxin
MILCDVNIYLFAMVAKSAFHQQCKAELESLLSDHRGPRLAVESHIMASVVRIATNPRLFDPVAPAQDVFSFIDAIIVHPAVVAISPADRHWRIYRDLVLSHDLAGGDCSDAWLAALAIEHGCEWWTTDRGFARFDGLSWRCLV